MLKIINKTKEVIDAIPSNAGIVKDREKLEEAAQKVANLNPDWKSEMEKYKRCEKSEVAENIIIGTGSTAVGKASAGLAMTAEVAVSKVPVVGPEIALSTYVPVVGGSTVIGGVKGAYMALDRIDEHHLACEKQKRHESNAFNLAKDANNVIEKAVGGFLDKIKNDNVQNQQEALDQITAMLERCKFSIQTYKNHKFPKPAPPISYIAVRRKTPLTWQAQQQPTIPTQSVTNSRSSLINKNRVQ